jgi:hypothetical protein
MKKTKRTEPAKPDAKGATQEILMHVAAWMELAGWSALGVHPASKRSPGEWIALEEARQLAIAYVKLGAKG